MIYGRIYKIYCNETAECYYGSTIETLSRRLSVHKSNYKAWKKGKYDYTTSFKIIERGNYTISLMEEGEFDNKDFMKARERHYIENFECVNKQVPNRTPKEYRETHREERKQYDEANKEHIAEQVKKYQQANKEHIAEYKKKWYEANLEQKTQKYTCECGSVICRDGKSKHEKTAKHIKAFSNKIIR